MASVSDVSLPLCAGEDTFELHVVQLELEDVDRQIRILLEKQAELRERQTALESSRADAQQSSHPADHQKHNTHHRPSHRPDVRSSRLKKKERVAFITLRERRFISDADCISDKSPPSNPSSFSSLASSVSYTSTEEAHKRQHSPSGTVYGPQAGTGQ
ncbi:hypothetical protein DPX16_23717 [Anabarilius grahami]|uniref:Uncharacterized protein n=1 Tax=Anabarilius grahami TaxID=495550 RepID=A0A3N0YP11_ANAGA|nr:hypothetical protein DPX16_23717 [Anabarilius grahami]